MSISNQVSNGFHSAFVWKKMQSQTADQVWERGISNKKKKKIRHKVVWATDRKYNPRW